MQNILTHHTKQKWEESHPFILSCMRDDDSIFTIGANYESFT